MNVLSYAPLLYFLPGVGGEIQAQSCQQNFDSSHGLIVSITDVFKEQSVGGSALKKEKTHLVLLVGAKGKTN